jgi:hypothetical protein
MAGSGGSRAPSQQSNLNGGNSIISNSEKQQNMTSFNLQAPHRINPSRAGTISMQDDETLHRHLVTESRLKKEEKVMS